MKENPKTDGMQAMAVAPIDKNGSVDISQVVISYAWTNPSDWTDLKTDLRTVCGFFDKTASPGFSSTPSDSRAACQEGTSSFSF
ncbi:hypothetical protein ACQ3MN_07750 [Enterococcus faecalis]|uniref:hypothetical protein n=1 Tax=Enterococcus faecalis TaxID=1351 RepID=UPI003D787BC7